MMRSWLVIFVFIIVSLFMLLFSVVGARMDDGSYLPIIVGVEAGPTVTPTPTITPTATPTATPVSEAVPPPNYKVAFIGDTGNDSGFTAVLNLIKTEETDLVLHQGDFDYSENPTAFFTTINNNLGAEFPYLASVGNHDDLVWNTDCMSAQGCYAQFLVDRMALLNISPDDPDLNDQKYAIDYQGLSIVFVGENGNNEEFAQFINDQLSADDHIWKICSWHKNQQAMQVGGKTDSMGWAVYENCLSLGAIVATGHEHSYSRTRTLINTENQMVDPQCAAVDVTCVTPGKTFVFVSGLGGRSIRDQELCLPATFPYGCEYWANIYSSNQGASYGALFITFHVDGDPYKARGYFKNIDGNIIDEFDIHAAVTPP